VRDHLRSVLHRCAESELSLQYSLGISTAAHGISTSPDPALGTGRCTGTRTSAPPGSRISIAIMRWELALESPCRFTVVAALFSPVGTHDALCR
jgi:hypothetical protein